MTPRPAYPLLGSVAGTPASTTVRDRAIRMCKIKFHQQPDLVSIFYLLACHFAPPVRSIKFNHVPKSDQLYC